MISPLLEVQDQQVHFRLPGDGLFRPGHKVLKAVDGISFSLAQQETLGIVGESGCGKSTLARGILGLVPVTGGSVRLAGEELTKLSHEAMRAKREEMQIVFQDPLVSLDPRMTVNEIIAEPLQVFRPGLSRADRRQLVEQMRDRVGLLPQDGMTHPGDLQDGHLGASRDAAGSRSARLLRRPRYSP